MEQKKSGAASAHRRLKKREALVLPSPWVALASQCACRFCLGAVLASGRILGEYSPFALGFVAASGAGAGGFFALIGAALGYLLSMPIANAFRYVATAILIYAVSFAFFDLKIYSTRLFMPLCSAGVGAITGFVYLAEQGWSLENAVCYITELALIGCSTRVYALCVEEKGEPEPKRWALLLAAGTLAVALSRVALPFGVSLGGVLSAALILWAGADSSWFSAAPAGLCLGLCLDLAQGGGAVCAAAFGLGGALTAIGARWGRHTGVLTFLSGVMAVSLWSYASAGTLSPVLNGALGCCLYLALPARVLNRLKRGAPAPASVPAKAVPVPAAVPQAPTAELLQQRLRQQSGAFRTLFEQVSGDLKVQEEPPLEPMPLFQRASRQVCRGCTFRSACWTRDKRSTEALLQPVIQALDRRGKVSPGDFPVAFSARCTRLNELVNALNGEYAGEVTRRRYRRRIQEGQRSLCAQYDQMAKILGESARAVEPAAIPAMGVTRLHATAGVAAGKRSGQSVSGDAGGWFRDEGGMLWVVLCDGMGSGPEAARDSRFAYHTLENMITAGISPEVALTTLASALGLRWETTGSFTTIDLLELNLNTGEGAVYKLGAAPTYLRRDGALRCITSSTLPAGLNRDATPEISRFHLRAGDLAVLVSDGVTDGSEDGWVRDQICAFTGDSPKELAAGLLCHENPVSDDRTAIVLLLKGQGEQAV